jgi:hypothetical protein
VHTGSSPQQQWGVTHAAAAAADDDDDVDDSWWRAEDWQQLTAPQAAQENRPRLMRQQLQNRGNEMTAATTTTISAAAAAAASAVPQQQQQDIEELLEGLQDEDFVNLDAAHLPSHAAPDGQHQQLLWPVARRRGRGRVIVDDEVAPDDATRAPSPDVASMAASSLSNHHQVAGSSNCSNDMQSAAAVINEQSIQNEANANLAADALVPAHSPEPPPLLARLASMNHATDSTNPGGSSTALARSSHASRPSNTRGNSTLSSTAALSPCDVVVNEQSNRGLPGTAVTAGCRNQLLPHEHGNAAITSDVDGGEDDDFEPAQPSRRQLAAARVMLASQTAVAAAASAEAGAMSESISWCPPQQARGSTASLQRLVSAAAMQNGAAGRAGCVVPGVKSSGTRIACRRK